MTQPMSGIQRYAYNIARRIPDAKIVSPGPATENYPDVAERAIVTGRAPHPYYWEQVVLPRYVGKGELLWSPLSTGPCLMRNHVLTIHDMAVFDMPETFSKAYVAWYKTVLPIAAKNVRCLITVSSFSKERIIETLHVRPERVHIVPEAADEMFRPLPASDVAEATTKYGITKKYLLALGAVSPRKNFARVLDAWRRISPDYEDAEMIIVGQKDLFFSASSDLGDAPSRSRHLSNVSDHDLHRLMCGAVALIYPSLYEGFGLPVLEAMASGTPVLTSNTSSLPEVAGDAAICVDPLSVDAIAIGMRSLLSDEPRRAQLAALGFERAAQFSWDSTTRQIQRLLSEALG